MGFLDSSKIFLSCFFFCLSFFLLFACCSAADIEKKASRCNYRGRNIRALPDPLCTATVIAAQCSCAMPQQQGKANKYSFPFAWCIDWKAQQSTVGQKSESGSEPNGTEELGEKSTAEMHSTTFRVQTRDSVCGAYPTEKMRDEKTDGSCMDYLEMVKSRFMDAPKTIYPTSKPIANISKNDDRWLFCSNICRDRFGCNYTLKIEETFNLAAQSLRRRGVSVKHWVPSFNERTTQHLNMGTLYLFGADKICDGFPRYQPFSSVSPRFLSDLRNGLLSRRSSVVKPLPTSPTRPTPITIFTSGDSLAANHGLSLSVCFALFVCLTTHNWQN